jgi:hypothetical protein
MYNNPNNHPWPKGIIAAAIIAATGVLIGLPLMGWAGLAAVSRVFAEGAPHWGILVIQIVVAIMSVVVTVVIGLLLAGVLLFLASKVLEGVTGRMEKLETNYEKQLNQLRGPLRGRAPTFVAGTALLGQAALVVVDKSFGEDELKVVLMSVLFVIAFGLANTLMLRSSWKAWSAGCVAWVLTFCSVPLFVMGYYSWNVQELSNNVLQMLSTDRQTLYIASVIIVSVILFLFVLPIYSLYKFLDRKESLDPADPAPD